MCWGGTHLIIVYIAHGGISGCSHRSLDETTLRAGVGLSSLVGHADVEACFIQTGPADPIGVGALSTGRCRCSWSFDGAAAVTPASRLVV